MKFLKYLKEPMGFLTATMFLNFAGLTIIIPVIPYLVGNYTQHVAFYMGFITSIAAFCQFLATPALGYISDIYGRRPVILWSLLGGVVGYILFGIGGSLWMLFLSRIIDGLSGGDTTAMYAYVADIYDAHKRTKYYGILGAAAGLGFMIGPVIGGLAAEISIAAPLFVAAGLGFINTIWGYFCLPESLKNEYRVKKFERKHLNPFNPFRYIFSSLTLRVLFITSFIFFVGIIMQQSNFSVFLKDILTWGPIQIGIVLTLVGLVDFIAEGYLTSVLTSFLGEVKVAKIGTLMTAVGMIMVGIVAMTSSAAILYISVIVYTLGDGLFEPAMTTLIANATEPDMHGRIQGANQSIQAVARSIAPLLAGSLYELRAYMPYFTSALLLIITLVMIVIYKASLKFNQSVSI